MKKIISLIIIMAMAFMLASSTVNAQETEETQAAWETQNLITVEMPDLTDTGMIIIDGIGDIHVSAGALDVTDEEVEQELQIILYNKNEDETEDEFVQRYSSDHLRDKLETVEELREYEHDEIYHSKLDGAILDVLNERTTVESYPEEMFGLLKEYALQELTTQVEVYAMFGMEGWDEEAVAQDLGYATKEDFLIEEAMYYGKYIMILDELAVYYQVTCTEEDVENAILDLMSYYGYDEELTLEEYTELNGGDPWLLMVEKLNVEYHKVMSQAEEFAVIDEGEESTDLQEEEQETKQETKSDDSAFTDLTYFSARTMDGDKITQDIFAGKDLTIINIWTTWCPYCIEEMPDLAEYAGALPDNIQFMTYCADATEEEELAKEILESSGMAEQNVLTIVSGTDDFEVLDSQVMYLPTTVFVNSRGEMVGEPIIGGQADVKAVLDERVAEALDE